MDDYIKRLVITRLMATPPGVSLSIGNFGKFNSQQLIHEVEKGSPIGKLTIETQLNSIRHTADIANWLHNE